MPDYRIEIADAHAHRWGVSLEIDSPGSDELIVSLPVWIPGSYMVRDFARHLLRLDARQGRRAVAVTAIDKTTWRIAPSPRGARAKLVLRYEVYGFDPSVRASFIDAERGFFNGTSLLLRVHGREHEPHRITFGALPRGWRVATAMRKQGSRYIAADYDEAVDHPFELGAFWRGRFDARGVEHEFVIAGAWPDLDGDRLLADAQRICAAQIDFWHAHDGAHKGAHDGAHKASLEGTRKRAHAAPRGGVPFERYLFILHAVDDGYGGLEHRASTALIASRKDLPRRSLAAALKGKRGKQDASARDGANAPMSDDYVTLLGLVSHEYFHTWNVKRLKPAELAAIDYTRENHTPLLWFFEGFTSYYDDLLLRRAGLIDDARYLKLVAKQLNGVLATPGRKVQSLAQASFDAWTKYYRSDESTPNLTVSYYLKGALVALALDLEMRQRGQGTLDDVMRALWQHSAAAQGGGAIDEAAIAQVLHQVAGRAMDRELRAWVHGTDDPPWIPLLESMGVAAKAEPTGSLAALLGLRVIDNPSGVQVKAVLDGGAAQRAGISAGDELIAFDGWRLRKLDDALAWWRGARPFELTVARGQRLRNVRVGDRALKSALDSARKIALAPAAQPDAATLERRKRWLGS